MIDCKPRKQFNPVTMNALPNLTKPMTYTHEKFMMGFAGLFSSGVSALGAIVVNDDALKFLYMTLCVTTITSFFLALVFRRNHETIRMVVGRCGLAILGGVFGTRILLHHSTTLGQVDDVIYILGIAGGVTIASFLVGYALLQIINQKASSIASTILSKWGLGPDKSEEE